MSLNQMQDFSFKHSDQQDAIYTQYSAQQIKSLFDSRGDELRNFITSLINILNSTQGAANIALSPITDFSGSNVQLVLQNIHDILKSQLDSNSGADFIGATVIPGVTGNTIQAILEGLKKCIDDLNITSYAKKEDLLKTTGATMIKTSNGDDVETALGKKLEKTGDFTGTWNGVKFDNTQIAVNAELVGARHDNVNNTDYENVGKRLDAHSSQLADIMSVSSYGADNTKTNDSYQAFVNALQNNVIVRIPKGDYLINAPITILDSYKVQKIIGSGEDNSRIFFTGTDGIINHKSGIDIEGVGLIGTGMGKGVKVLAPIQMNNCEIYNFDIGIDLANQVHVITSHFENVTAAYNKSYGVKVISGETYQNNGITFKGMYIVKNGTDADTLASDATINSGDGMYIDGGYAILIQDCVFEYNTGCGLIIKTNSYPLYGVTISNPYFERNKYANLYIDNVSTYDMINIDLHGAFYSEAGLPPVSNALSERFLYVKKPNKNMGHYYGNHFEKYGFADRNILNRRANFLNAFPFNSMDDLCVDYPSNIVNYNGEKCFTITSVINGITFSGEIAYIDSNYDYIFSYDIKKVGTTYSPNLLAYLYDNDTNALVGNGMLNLNCGAFDWKTVSIKVTGLSTIKTIRLYLNIEGTKPADEEIYIKNIKLIPIIKNTSIPSDTTANRPTSGLFIGKPYFDTTINKPIWYNGTNWVDATGTTV